MVAGYDTVVFHDADEARLQGLVELAAKHMQDTYGWKRRAGDLPSSIGLEKGNFRISIGVEDKSFRILSECKRPIPIFDWGRNRENVNVIRRYVRKRIQGEAAGLVEERQ